jgi:creatinine amidohydrolase
MCAECAEWGRYEELRPDQLQRVVAATPVAYWPLGLLEHHGWHLPVGFDGIKADRLCVRMAERTGGVVLPVMWWGAGGGHGDFKWTLYQPTEAPRRVLETTLPKLIASGFRAIVLPAGHYPWRGILEEVLPPLREGNPDVLFLAGTEMELGGPDVKLPGDHAARWETAYGLALLPELVEMDALRGGRSETEAWPDHGPPPEADRHEHVVFDAGAPLFAQAGKDARRADGQDAARLLDALVEAVKGRVERHLAGA